MNATEAELHVVDPHKVVRDWRSGAFRAHLDVVEIPFHAPDRIVVRGNLLQVIRFLAVDMGVPPTEVNGFITRR